MANSPGVEAFEFDATINITATGDSSGAIVGSYTWGPCEQAVQLSDTDNLIAVFGKPTNDNYQEWFSASNFLNYTGSLYNIRVIDDASAKNAGIAPTSNPQTGDPLVEQKGILFKNAKHFEMAKIASAHLFTARFAGSLGNSIEVSIADAKTFDTWAYKNLFDTAPNSTPGSETMVADANDEIHIAIIDKAGLFTRQPGAVLETYAYLSKAKDGRDMSGAGAYYVSVLNRQSKYVYVVNPLGDALMDDMTDKSAWGRELFEGKPFAELKEAFTFQLGLGSDGTKPTKSNFVSGYELVESIEDENLNMIISGACGGDANHAEVANTILNVALKSQRLVGFISPKMSDVVNVSKDDAVTNIEATHKTLTSLHSYGHLSTSYKFQYDKYNDAYRWVPGNADDAGLYARTHNTVGKYAPGAGYNRGKYANVVSLAFSPDKTARDRMYKLGINSVIEEKGEGIILLGDRTLQPKKSAFSAMGTRFLFIDLRTMISRSAKYNLFEFNDTFTRSQFKDSVEPVLRDIRGKRGIVDFFVRCDEKNNPTSVVEAGEFIGDIFIKPQYTIQYVRLNFTAVGQGVSFEETVVNAIPVM